jgi:hypothetical protein
MAEITLEYDARNTVAKKLIDFILSSNIVKVKKKKATGLDEALEDLEKGNVTTYKDFDEYKKEIHKLVENV